MKLQIAEQNVIDKKDADIAEQEVQNTKDRFSSYCFFKIDQGRYFNKVMIYRRLLIGRDGHLDLSEDFDISQLVREYTARTLISLKPSC